MSLLSAVIQEADKTNTEDVKKARNELLPRIIDLAERLQVFSWGLQNYFIDVYLTSNSSRSLEQMNYKNRKYRANEDLDELQEDIEAFRKQFGEKNEEINIACKNLDASVKFFNDSCTLVDGTYILQKAARDLKSLKYVDVVVNLSDLHKRLDKLDFQGNLATALRSFRAISETQLAVSQGQLSVEFSNIFRWNFNRGVHTLKYSLLVQQSDPILLERVLTALYIANQMVIDIQPFSYFLVASVLPNIIKHNCEISTEEQVGSLVFNIKIDLNDTTRPSIPTIFNNLTTIFEFLETTMGTKFEADVTFFESLGDCNRDEFFSVLIQDCIKTNLPHDENSHQAYKEIVLELETFNKFLVDLKYVEAAKSPLKKYIDHTDLLMYDTKCRKMLAEVRELMKENICQGIIKVGSVSDSPDKSIVDVTNKKYKYDLKTPIFFPKCMVSQNVKKIATNVTSYLEESAKMPVEYANQLVPYIKDVAVMYKGMVLHKNSIRLKTHALEIALFFNNCHYLAHALVGPPWKNILPNSVADQLNSSLMGFIHELRVTGLEKLSIYLKRNREVISAKIAGVFRHWRLEAFEAFNKDVNHVLALLKENKETWYEVLPGRMYQQAMCTLLEAAIEAMVNRALRYVEDISEDVVCLLASRFQYTIDEIQEEYPELLAAEHKLKSWEKFKLIPKLFTAQLFEITRLWNETNTLRGKFCSEEVRLILKMRFPNTDYRLRVLKWIE